MRKLNIFLIVSLVALLCSIEGNAVQGKKREREENENVDAASPLGIGTHLCRVDHGFKASGKHGVWKNMPADERLRTAFLPCNVLVPELHGDASKVVVQILPVGAYYAPFHRPIAVPHADAIATNKFRQLRVMHVGMHVFAKWEGPHDAGAPKLWEAEVVAFNIQNKTASIRWMFAEGDHDAQMELPFSQLYHIPRE